MTPGQKWLGIGCALAVLCIWSSFILIARSSAKHTLTAFDIAFVRFVFSGVLVLPLLGWRAARAARLSAALQGVSLARAFTLGAFAGIGYCGLAYSGFFFAPATHGAILLPGSLPLWTALTAAALLSERIGPMRYAGLGLIVVGDLFVGASSLVSAFDGGEVWKGDLLFLCASLTWSIYAVLCRKWHIGAITATLAVAFSCLVTAVPLYAIGVASGAWPSRLAQAGWNEIAFQGVYQGGVTMLIAGVAFTQVVTTFGPLRTVMITALVPVITALAAVPLLGEPLTPTVIMGLVCVTAGLLLGLRAACPMHGVAESPQGNEGPLPRFLDPLAGPDAKLRIRRRS
jgi:drug/metabolite transporter (DMT)-like permease